MEEFNEEKITGYGYEIDNPLEMMTPGEFFTYIFSCFDDGFVLRWERAGSTPDERKKCRELNQIISKFYVYVDFYYPRYKSDKYTISRYTFYMKGIM